MPAATKPGAADSAGLGLEAWKGFVRAHARLFSELDVELQQAENVTLGDYDVLVQLADSPVKSMRMCELAESVLLSPSGLSRRVERLERRGLVRRERSAQDARSVEASITDEGRRLFRRLRRLHRDGIDRHFSSRFTERELETLGPLLGRLTGDE